MQQIFENPFTPPEKKAKKRLFEKAQPVLANEKKIKDKISDALKPLDMKKSWNWKEGQRVIFDLKNIPKGFEADINSLTFSENGEIIAVSIENKTLETIMVNGRIWKKKYPRNTITTYPIISPDGSRVAVSYSKYRDKHKKIIVNGRDFFEVEAGKRAKVGGDEFGEFKDLVFSHDGKNLAFIYNEDAISHFQLYKNKKPWAKEYAVIKTPIFSPDGRKIASAVAKRLSGAIIFSAFIEKLEWTIVVNDKEWDNKFKSCEQPVFSPDSTQVGCLVKLDENGHTAIVINDKIWDDKFANYFSAPLFSPDSKNIAAIVRKKDAKEDEYKTITVNNGEKTWATNYYNIHSMCFSPDSNKIAAVVGTESPKFFSPGRSWFQESDDKQTVTIDGEINWKKKFDKIQDLTFSPDSQNLAVKVFKGKKWTLAINDLVWQKEFEEIKCFDFSHDGSKIMLLVKGGNKYIRIVKKVADILKECE